MSEWATVECGSRSSDRGQRAHPSPLLVCAHGRRRPTARASGSRPRCRHRGRSRQCLRATRRRRSSCVILFILSSLHEGIPLRRPVFLRARWASALKGSCGGEHGDALVGNHLAGSHASFLLLRVRLKTRMSLQWHALRPGVSRRGKPIGASAASALGLGAPPHYRKLATPSTKLRRSQRLPG
jgi:hypothetical protein